MLGIGVEVDTEATTRPVSVSIVVMDLSPSASVKLCLTVPHKTKDTYTTWQIPVDVLVGKEPRLDTRKSSLRPVCTGGIKIAVGYGTV